MVSPAHIVLFAGLTVGGILAMVIAKLQQERPQIHNGSPPRRDRASDSHRASNSRSPQCDLCNDRLNNDTPLIKMQCCGAVLHEECHGAFRSALLRVRGSYSCPRCQSRRTS